MSLVSTDTSEIVEVMSEEQARRLVARINGTVAELEELVAQAWAGRAWVALGYGSWDELCEAEIKTPRLDRDQRREFVGSLRQIGMSTRAIASAVGVDQSTVSRDLSSGDAFASPAPGPTEPEPDPFTDLADFMDEATNRMGSERRCDGCGRRECVCRMLDDQEPEPEVEPRFKASMLPKKKAPVTAPKITGTDGKSYSSTTPARPRRGSLNDSARNAGIDFRKAVERLERIAADDRFPANREQVAAHLRGHLTYAIEVCQDLLDGLTTGPQEDR